VKSTLQSPLHAADLVWGNVYSEQMVFVINATSPWRSAVNSPAVTRRKCTEQCTNPEQYRQVCRKNIFLRILFPECF